MRSIYLGGSLFEVGLDLLVLGLPGFFLLRTLPDLDVPGKECRDTYVRRTCPSGGFVRMTTICGVLYGTPCLVPSVPFVCREPGRRTL